MSSIIILAIINKVITTHFTQLNVQQLN